MITRLSTKELLAKSFEDLLTRKKLENIHIKDITVNCGVSRQTFYNNFEDIHALIYWIVCQDLSRYVDMINGTTYTWREATMDSYILYREKINFYKEALKYTGQNSMTEFSFPEVEKACLNAISRIHKNFEPDDEFLFALQFYLKGTSGIIRKWILDGCKKSPEIMCNRIISCMPETIKKMLL